MKTEYPCAQCGASVWRNPSGVVGRVFCSRACCDAAKTGEPSKRRPMVGPDHPRWKGGAFLMNGYRYLWMPGHPMASKTGYVAEHRLVVSERLGRPLKSSEHVHHRNQKRADNRPDNLMAVLHADHARLHQARRRILFPWSRDAPACRECGTSERRHCGRGLCYRCYHRAHMAKMRKAGYIAPSRRKS